MIRKSGGKWCLYSKTKGKKGKRKNLGCYSSLEGTQKREKDVKKFKHMKEEGVMNIKKSQIYEMIKEELEVILTNDEAHEIFDLDPKALLDAMMKETVVSIKDNIVAETNGLSDRPPGQSGLRSWSGKKGRSARAERGQALTRGENELQRLTRRVGTHVDDKVGTKDVVTWAQREKQEILDRLSGIKADGDYSPQEKEGLLVAQALEGIVNDALDIVFRDEDSWKKNRAPVLAAAEGFRRKLAALAKNVASEVPGAAEEDLAEAKRTAKGNITQATRKKHATVGKDKFPIFDKKSAEAAIDLRGHAPKADRAKIINKAAKYAPAAAKKAREADKKKKKG